MPHELAGRARVGHVFGWHTVVGRLAPGSTEDTARTAMTLGAQRLAAAYPETRRGANVVVRRHDGFGPNHSPLEILLVLAVMLSLPLTVLLIGCANVANLQLARAQNVREKPSVRFALGASTVRHKSSGS